MKKKKMTPLSKFPTEVLVFYFKKFRKCRHCEYEKIIRDEDGDIIDDELIIEDVTTAPFVHKYDSRDDFMFIRFEGLYWNGKCSEFLSELHKRGNVDISPKSFKDWKREYKKNKNESKRKEKTVLRK